ncbi:MAG: DUF3570 domain-containing protein, partial [Gammaproteobacteria bacterium]|nr:DUF3570 domain-containing protein [Gammaproteobacteria bacterium]
QSGVGAEVDVDDEEFKLDLRDKKWQFKSAILGYSEKDRVDVLEPTFQITRKLGFDESISFKVTVDALTGASPSGAVPIDGAQTITRPSGSSGQVIGEGDEALDDTFKDTRVALNTAWVKPLGRNMRLDLSGNVSDEYDFFSAGVGAQLSRDLNRKNTTLSAGVAFEYDEIDPVGGVPIAFQPVQPPGAAQFKEDRIEDKTVIDLLFGVTQVINSTSLLQLNYGYSMSDGYQTDPYKLLSEVDNNGDPIVRDPTIDLYTLRYENRPEERNKQSVYTRYKKFLKGDVLDFSYRYLWDDWDINSHTVDVRYRWDTPGKGFWRPHFRYYHQSAAEFYTPFLRNDQPQPEYASADTRLGEFDAYTIGLEYGRESAKRVWSVAFEYYLQTGDEPDEKFGNLLDEELFPDLDAFMVRVNYDF